MHRYTLIVNMDKFLVGRKRKLEDEEASTSSKTPSTSANPITKSKTRKYDQDLNFGFTSTKIESGEEKPQLFVSKFWLQIA